MKVLVKTTWLHLLVGIALSVSCLLYTGNVHAVEQNQTVTVVEEQKLDLLAKDHDHLPNNAREEMCA